MRTSLDKRIDSRSPRWLVREITPSGSLAPETHASAISPRMYTPPDDHDSLWNSPHSKGVKALRRRGSSDGSTDEEEDETYYSNGERVRTAPEVTFSRRDDATGGRSDIGSTVSTFHKQSPRHREASSDDWRKLPLSKLLKRPEDENQSISARSDGLLVSGRSAPFSTSPRQNQADSTQDWKKLNLSKLASSEQEGESIPQSGKSSVRPPSARSSSAWNPGGYTPRSYSDFRDSSATPPYTPPLSRLVDRPSTSPRHNQASIQRMYKTLMSENERMHAELGSAVQQNDALKKSLGALEQEIAVLRNPRPSAGTAANTPRGSVPRWSQSQSRAEREEDGDSPAAKKLLRVMREKNGVQTELEQVRLELARERLRRRKLEEDVQEFAEVKEKYDLLHLRHYGHRPIRTSRTGADAFSSSKSSWNQASPRESYQTTSPTPSPGQGAERAAPQQPRAQQGFAWSSLVSSLGF